MPASSQASSELSTASLIAVRRAFLGLSKPSKCLFFAKNSLTDMSRCFAAIDSAVTARRFGCSSVSLTFGIFMCSSILPDFTLVHMDGEIRISCRNPAGASFAHVSLVQFRRAIPALYSIVLGYHVGGCPRGQPIAMTFSETV